jgi:hypothetical protein
MRAWGVRKGVMCGGSSTSVFVPSCYCPSIAATRTLLWRRAGDVCWAQRGVSTWVRTIKAFDKEPSERNISKGSQLEMHRSALMQTNVRAWLLDDCWLTGSSHCCPTISPTAPNCHLAAP